MEARENDHRTIIPQITDILWKEVFENWIPLESMRNREWAPTLHDQIALVWLSLNTLC